MEAIPIIRDFMSTHLITVQPEVEIYQALNLLLNHKISGAPVVEYNRELRRVVGILSAKDCMLILTNGAFYNLPEGRVQDFMSREVMTIEPERDIFAAAEIFLKHSYRRIPVVEDENLIGIVTRGDVLMASRRLWKSQYVQDAPDPGYLTDDIRAKLGDKGMSHLHKKYS